MANKKIYKLKLDQTQFWITTAAFYIVATLTPIAVFKVIMYIGAAIMWISALMAKDTMIEISNDEE